MEALGVEKEQAEAQVVRLTRANTALEISSSASVSSGGHAQLPALPAFEGEDATSLPALADLTEAAVDEAAANQGNTADAEVDDTADAEELKCLLDEHALDTASPPRVSSSA